jgi:signal transduction histidine kinase
MDRLGLTLRYSLVDRQAPLKTLASAFASDAILVLVLLLALSFTVGFEEYWFIYGISALYLAVRHGFEIAIIGNATVFILVYFLPLVLGKDLVDKMAQMESLTDFHLGMCLLYVCTAVVGRVISDLKKAEQLMQSKNRVLELTNEELHHTNRELDRFVYSVSHDLSAPLKSMMGLVNISRIENDVTKLRSYFDLVGNRIEKLENFIAEVLDFSRSNRKELKIEQIDLAKLIEEVIAIHQDSDELGKLVVERRIKVRQVQTDRLLLRIILNNLISNAIKYQKNVPGHQPVVGISCTEDDHSVLISIKDNGEGIPEEIYHRLFTMFFRGHSKSTGSGLGLYIAKEAATRIQTKITFTSLLGQGSEFTVKLPK